MTRYPDQPAKVRAANIKARYHRHPREGGERLHFETNRWTRHLLRPLLVAVLATALGTAFLTVVRIGTPELPWLALIPFCFIVALEGAYTAAWLGNPESYGVDKAIYRIAEAAVILVLARLVSWWLFGPGIPSVEEIRVFLQSPSLVLLAGGFITTAFVALGVWWYASRVSAIFNQLDISPYELDFYTLSLVDQKIRSDDQPIGKAREELQSGFLAYWLGGAILIVLLAALSTFEVAELATVANPFDFTRLGLQPWMLIALLAYFLMGFWLLSHSRLLRMNAHWLKEGVAHEASFEGSWQRNSLIVLLVVAIAASFLPIGSTVPIGRVLEYGLAGIGFLVSTLMTLFSVLFGSFMALMSALMGADETEQIPRFEMPEFQPPPMQAADSAPGALTFIITSAFWALVVVGSVAATIFFLRERGYAVELGGLQKNWERLRSWLAELWQGLTGRARRVRRSLSRGLEAGLPGRPSLGDLPKTPRWPFLRINSLSPREQIRYFYLSTVRRAQESGVERRQGETPLEYARDLKGRFPDAEEDVEALTQAFVHARYSDHPVEGEEVNPIKERWKRIKARLRSRHSR